MNEQHQISLTQHINNIRLDEDLTVKEVFKLYPEFVDEHQEEMWNDYENGRLDDRYYFSEYLQQIRDERRRQAQWKKQQGKKKTQNWEN